MHGKLGINDIIAVFEKGNSPIKSRKKGSAQREERACSREEYINMH